jgi:hypothetical protein
VPQLIPSVMRHPLKMSLEWLKDYFRRGDNLPRVVIIVALAISGIPLFAVLIYRDANDPETKSNQIELEREFRAIKHLPQAKESDYDDSQKSGLAYVSASYENDLRSEEALSYYDTELATHDWLFYEEEQGVRHYCKGKYKATLSCGQNASKSHCEISLNWGFETFVEKYFTGNKYRSRGCRD